MRRVLAVRIRTFLVVMVVCVYYSSFVRLGNDEVEKRTVYTHTKTRR